MAYVRYPVTNTPPPGSIVNADISPTAAIDFSKLAVLASGNILVGSAGGVATSVAVSGDLTLTSAGVTAIGASKVTNAMLAGSIAYSKLVLTGSVTNADLAGSIAYSKLVLTGSVTNADLAGSIAYSKLVLTGSVTNADLAGSIAYSKLVLTSSIVNADIASGAAIAGTKISPVFGSQNITNTGSYTLTGAADTIQLKVIANATQTSKVFQVFQSDGTTNSFSVSNSGQGIFAGALSASNLSGTNTGDQTTVSGNAGTATTLQTARNINGVSFNGSADITVTAAAGTLTGTTLASNVVTSSLTALGTVTTLKAGSFAAATSAKSANYAFLDTDGIRTVLATTGSSTLNFTVPSPSLNPGRMITLKKADNSTGKATFLPFSSETFDGASSLVCVDQDDFYNIQSDGTNWAVIAKGMGTRVVSRVRDEIGAGYGSTNTKIRRIETNVVNTGNAITRAISSTAGNSYTINQAGFYSMQYSDRYTGGSGELGISLNSNQLTTNCDAITATTRIAYMDDASASGGLNVSATLRLSSGDVIRPHTDGGTAVTGNSCNFDISKIGL